MACWDIDKDQPVYRFYMKGKNSSNDGQIVKSMTIERDTVDLRAITITKEYVSYYI